MTQIVKEKSVQSGNLRQSWFRQMTDEALIVDPELPGIISREDYEKAGVEELAEWEV